VNLSVKCSENAFEQALPKLDEMENALAGHRYGDSILMNAKKS